MTATTPAAPTQERLYFFRRFPRNPRDVGAVCPSTRHLGAAILRDLALRPGDVVLEYGPGTGAITRVIEQRLDELGGSVSYLRIEREPGFCAILQQRFPRLRFANASVEDVRALLDQHGLGRLRAILSGLPLIFLPSMAEIVRTAYDVLAPGGTFRAFSYLQSQLTPGAHRLRKTMRACFDHFEMSRLVTRNFPPAFVLRGDRRRA